MDVFCDRKKKGKYIRESIMTKCQQVYQSIKMAKWAGARGILG